jgi:Tol biopolymer transport system component
MNVDGTNPVNLTSSQNNDKHWSAWSPDGTKILFSSSKTGNVHHVNADGTGAVNVTG